MNVTVTHNLKYNGMNVQFYKKPSDDILEWLPSYGYHCSPTYKVWYQKYDEYVYKWTKEKFPENTNDNVVISENGKARLRFLSLKLKLLSV